MNGIQTNEEMALSDDWCQRLFTDSLPMSFLIGGEKASTYLSLCRTTETVTTSGQVVLLVRQYTDTPTGLMMTLEIRQYKDFPCVEWVARVKNTSRDDSPVIENMQALSMDWTPGRSMCGHAANPAVRYAYGTHAEMDDFTLMEQALPPDEEFVLNSRGGKSSSHRMPFFNLYWGAQGVFVMIGWSGQWTAKLMRKGNGDEVSIAAGLERTCFKLHPGEEIRTPSIALLFWTGDTARSQNLLRRFIVKHHTPSPGGRPVTMPVSCMSWGGMKTQNHLKKIAYIQRAGIPYTNYWIDAGWFGPPHDVEEYQNMETEDWFGLVGDWRVNSCTHPDGLKVIGDAAHQAGMKFLLWLEPERAVLGTPVTLEHADWLIPLPSEFPRFNVGKYEKVESMLFNFGNPDARQWMTGFVSDLISEAHVDIYRQDMNTTLSKYWDSCDGPDRTGITEMKYIEGLYRFIDELQTRHPGLLIDNCSGGGARLDLEMISRSVCLHRTDYVCWPGVNTSAIQAQSLGMMHWLPFTCTGIGSARDTYQFRSEMSGGVNMALGNITGSGQVDFSIPELENGNWYKQMLSDHNLVKDLFACDFYPLTDCGISAENWHAFQLDNPELSKGAILVFRRENSPFTAACFQLRGVDENAEYELINIDTGQKVRQSGGQLAGLGFELNIPNMRESRIITYRKIAQE